MMGIGKNLAGEVGELSERRRRLNSIEILRETQAVYLSLDLDCDEKAIANQSRAVMSF